MSNATDDTSSMQGKGERFSTTVSEISILFSLLNGTLRFIRERCMRINIWRVGETR